MSSFKFRALITIDAASPAGPAEQYPSGTHSVMVRCDRLGPPHDSKVFPAFMYRDDDQPLRPGESSMIVTIELADQDACAFLGPGQAVTLWNGSDIGHGVISRRVFFRSGPV